MSRPNPLEKMHSQCMGSEKRAAHATCARISSSASGSSCPGLAIVPSIEMRPVYPACRIVEKNALHGS